MAMLAIGAYCAVFSVALQGGRIPDNIHIFFLIAIMPQHGTLLTMVGFCALAVPWVLAAFAGWRAVALALAATVVIIGLEAIYIMLWIVPRFGSAGYEYLAICVILSLVPTLPVYLAALVVRWLGFRMEWDAGEAEAR